MAVEIQLKFSLSYTSSSIEYYFCVVLGLEDSKILVSKMLFITSKDNKLYNESKQKCFKRKPSIIFLIFQLQWAKSVLRKTAQVIVCRQWRKFRWEIREASLLHLPN